MKTRFPLLVALLGVVAVIILVGGSGAQMARETDPSFATPPARQVEYLMISPHEIGLDLNIARTIDYAATTALMNAYAADGWRVREFGMFDYPAVLLERDVLPTGE
jgi:hypothetical protein